jgi:hypothetical protein
MMGDKPMQSEGQLVTGASRKWWAGRFGIATLLHACCYRTGIGLPGTDRHASSDASVAPLFVGLAAPGKKQDALRGRVRADEGRKVAFGSQVSPKPS